MDERCDLCGSSQLELAYRPPTSARGLAVYVCLRCGLVQSLPRIDHVRLRDVALSSGADWGNVRYGKGFRTEHAIALLGKAIDLAGARNCLDVGANRGSFILRMREIAPHASWTAIEPDASIVSDYASLEGVSLVIDRVENVSLPQEQFDLVYCSHTLEHLRSPRETLEQIRRAMARDRVLLLEVPNIAFIGREDVVEEWFIDKHLYHFSEETLQSYLRLAGFRLADDLSSRDEENITLIAFKSDAGVESQSLERAQLAQASLQQIKRYEQALHRNHQALQAAARRIEALASTRRVAVWGAGRIFDSLVQHGRLDVTSLVGVVDKYLSKFVESVHGCRLLNPQELAALVPDVVVIASRAYFEEIKRELLTRVPGCNTLGLADLLAVE